MAYVTLAIRLALKYVPYVCAAIAIIIVTARLLALRKRRVRKQCLHCGYPYLKPLATCAECGRDVIHRSLASRVSFAVGNPGFVVVACIAVLCLTLQRCSVNPSIAIIVRFESSDLLLSKLEARSRESSGPYGDELFSRLTRGRLSREQETRLVDWLLESSRPEWDLESIRLLDGKVARWLQRSASAPDRERIYLLLAEREMATGIEPNSALCRSFEGLLRQGKCSHYLAHKWRPDLLSGHASWLNLS